MEADELVEFPCSRHDVRRWASAIGMDHRSAMYQRLCLHPESPLRGYPGQVAACVAWIERNPEPGHAPPIERF